MAITNGRGVDASMEVVGAKAPVQTCFQIVRRGGSVTLVGNLTPSVDLPLQTVVTRELSIYGSCASNGEIPQCIELLASGAIQVAPLITATATASSDLAFTVWVAPSWVAILSLESSKSMAITLANPAKRSV